MTFRTRSLRTNLLPVLAAVPLTLLAGCQSGAAPASGSANMQPGAEEHIINHQVSPADLQAAKSPEPIKSDKVVLWVNGLGCPLCASNIDRQLERVRGVDSVAVDLSVGKVTLGLSSKSAHPSPARLADAVEDAGFTLVKVETP